MQPRLRSSHARILVCLAFGIAAATAVVAAGQPERLATPTFTAAQAMRGADLYSERCAQCHGAVLDDGQFAPALIGRGFARRWQGRTLADVFTLVRSQMPPDAPGSLDAAATADLLAFILEQNGFTVSTVELPADPTPLQTMLAVKVQ
jgi:mono/diheme cytochrome c family protein